VDAAERRRLTTLFRDDFLDWTFDFGGTAEIFGLDADGRARMEQTVGILYRSNIHHLDGLFGAVVAAIDQRGLRDESVVAFTADHGEILGRDAAGRRWTHGFALSPEDLMVPLLVRARGVSPGNWGGVSRSIDVFPTLAALAGVPVGDAVMGEDLSAALRGAEDHPALVAFSHTALQPDSWREPPYASIARGPSRRDAEGMWVAARWDDLMVKLTAPVGTPLAPHAYDWAADPGERKDLYDATNPRHVALVAQLDEYRAALIAGAARPGDELPIPWQQELLKSLGYIR
jgi:arylsulfatase A-like enzyme